MSKQKRVLYIDDEPRQFAGLFQVHWGPLGLDVVVEQDPDHVVQRLEEQEVDLVLLDLMFPDSRGRLVNRGLDVLEQIRARYPLFPVVVLTNTLADGDFSDARFSYAAFLYAKERFAQITTGVDPYEELGNKIIAAIGSSAKVSMPDDLGFIVGCSAEMLDLVDRVRRIAPLNRAVLIYGETGTGKEHLVKTIHRLSGRRGVEPVCFNCAATTEELLESTLFGYTEGAFTGAKRDVSGMFQEAEGGTLFLDEIESAPDRLQRMLLRALSERRIRPVGARNEVPVDVRVLAATNEQPEKLVATGVLRQDLYARLTQYRLDIPPLRQRTDDIPELALYFIRRFNSHHRESGKTILEVVRPDVMKILQGYFWPGNIRELENVINSACLDSRSSVLLPSDLPTFLSKRSATTDTEEAADDEMTRFAQRVFVREVQWQQLLEFSGSERKRRIEAIITEFATRNAGRVPKGKELAELLGTGADQVRQILSTLGVSLIHLQKGNTK